MGNAVEVLKVVVTLASRVDSTPAHLHGALVRSIGRTAHEALVDVGERMPLSDEQVWGDGVLVRRSVRQKHRVPAMLLRRLKRDGRPWLCG